MKNTFKFSYLTPTPDTLANIALCRWNDALKGLPAFIQIYMQSQHFLQGFGFSRALSYKEYLNKKITKDTDLKVYVGGYEINLSELIEDHDLDLVKISSGAFNLVTFFRITFETEEVLLDSNFISHDGTSIPVTEQNITITVELCYSDSTNWNFETQKPLSDMRGNTASALFDMENDDNSDGLYGRDCTLWTTPTEKTIYGYKWQCALPISFLMPDNLSVSNIYFDRQSGEFEALYTVPVVKRFFQNIEKAIYDTHLLNCLHDYNKTEEEINEENNEYIVVGGVNLDENTENLYPVAEDNDHIQFDIAEINSRITEISNDITTINSRMVTTHRVGYKTIGDDQEIYGAKYFERIIADMVSGIKFGDNLNDVYFNINAEEMFMTFNAYISGDDNDIQTIYTFRNNDTDIIKVDLDKILDNNGVYVTTFNGLVHADEIHTNVLNIDNGLITLGGNLLPKEGNEGSLGSTDNYFNNVFSYHFNGLDYTSCVTIDSIKKETKLSNGLTFQYTENEIDFSASISHEDDKIGISISGAKKVEVGVANTTFNSNIVANGKINAKGQIIADGNIDARGQLYVSKGINSWDNANDLGHNRNKFGHVWAERLHGVIDYPSKPEGSSEVNVPVGTIVCIQHSGRPGEAFTIEDNTSVRMAQLDGVALLDFTVSAGTYIPLSIQGESLGVVLAMRIA